MNTKTTQFIPLSEIKPPKKDTRTPWQIFSAAPHRLMFFGGFLQLLLTLLWWTIELLGRYTNWWPALPTVVFSTWIHGFLMIYGIFIFFIFGFLMTTYPRWMKGKEVTYLSYVSSFWCLLSGIMAIYAGLLVNKWIFNVGLLLVLIGWGIGFFALLQVYYTAPARDKHYETFLNLALLAGGLGILAYLLSALTEQWWLMNAVIQIGPWLFLVPIFTAVAHRMIPYFSSTVLPNYRIVQPRWSLPIIAITVIGHALLTVETTLWAWRFIFDIPLMLLAFHHSYHWQLRQSYSIRLLAMLHLAFLWLGLALLLYNVQNLWLLTTGVLILGKAPLHALTIGFMTSMMIAMASRVTLGHSGRFLVADNLTWFGFWGISIVAILRILAEIPALNFLYLNLVSGILWLIVMTLWVSLYLPMVLKARVDGNPG